MIYLHGIYKLGEVMLSKSLAFQSVFVINQLFGFYFFWIIYSVRNTFNLMLGLAVVIKQNREGTNARGFRFNTLTVK